MVVADGAVVFGPGREGNEASTARDSSYAHQECGGSRDVDAVAKPARLRAPHGHRRAEYSVLEASIGLVRSAGSPSTSPSS